jgi:Toluene-4-monooxygenase system protein B (TmoB)
VIPLYGFLDGDTLGVLLLAGEDETIAELAAKLQTACALRVAPHSHVQLIHEGRALPPELSVTAAELQPLDRIDVIVESPAE